MYRICIQEMCILMYKMYIYLHSLGICAIDIITYAQAVYSIPNALELRCCSPLSVVQVGLVFAAWQMCE